MTSEMVNHLDYRMDITFGLPPKIKFIYIRQDRPQIELTLKLKRLLVTETPMVITNLQMARKPMIETISLPHGEETWERPGRGTAWQSMKASTIGS